MRPMNTVRLRLRPVVPADHPTVLRILKEATAEQAASQGLIDDVVQFGREDLILKDAMLVCADDEPIGILSVDKRPGDWRLRALKIEAGYRRKGFGTLLLLAILDEAQAARVSVSVILEHGNAAIRLFQRQGFEILTRTATEVLLKRRVSPKK